MSVGQETSLGVLPYTSGRVLSLPTLGAVQLGDVFSLDDLDDGDESRCGKERRRERRAGCRGFRRWFGRSGRQG